MKPPKREQELRNATEPEPKTGSTAETQRTRSILCGLCVSAVCVTKMDAQRWPNLLVVKNFFDAEACDRLVADMLAAGAVAATVYGRDAVGGVDESTRRTLRVSPSPGSLTLLEDSLQRLKPRIEEHFDLTLTEVEEPQFLRYREGDFFVAHQDGNTGLLRLETESRRVSVVIFLSRESDTRQPASFCGGSLVFTDLRHEKFQITAEPGTLVAFRSETTHEVIPVTFGERLSIASWYR